MSWTRVAEQLHGVGVRGDEEAGAHPGADLAAGDLDVVGGRRFRLSLPVGDPDVHRRVQRPALDDEAREAEVGSAGRDPQRVVHRARAAGVDDGTLARVGADRDRRRCRSGARP